MATKTVKVTVKIDKQKLTELSFDGCLLGPQLKAQLRVPVLQVRDLLASRCLSLTAGKATSDKYEKHCHCFESHWPKSFRQGKGLKR